VLLCHCCIHKLPHQLVPLKLSSLLLPQLPGSSLSRSCLRLLLLLLLLLA
jgi:hypothetical protein